MYDNTNNKVYGKFKDESSGIPIKSVIALRPKLYNINYEYKDTKNVCKGIKHHISKKLSEIDYKNCLINHKIKNIEQSTIVCKKHELYSSIQNKIALSYNDDKIYIASDNIHCYNFGFIPDKIYK